MMDKLVAEMKTETMWPPPALWFKVFEDDPEVIRVVILGQDPYPTPHRATGYSFEIAGDVDDSLHVIFDSIKKQYKDARIDYQCGDLSHWRAQGVMLMNAALSVCGSRARTRTKKVDCKELQVTETKPRKIYGIWSHFTKGAMRVLCKKQPYVVFVLWGRDAAKFHTLAKAPVKPPHGVVMSYHPSELAQTVANPGKPELKLFKDVEHFREVNNLLEGHGLTQIDWSNVP